MEEWASARMRRSSGVLPFSNHSGGCPFFHLSSPSPCMRYHHSPLSGFNSYFLPEMSVHIIAMIASVHNRRLRLASLASLYPSALPPLPPLPPAPRRYRVRIGPQPPPCCPSFCLQSS